VRKELVSDRAERKRGLTERSNGWQLPSSYLFVERPRKFQSARALGFSRAACRSRHSATIILCQPGSVPSCRRSEKWRGLFLLNPLVPLGLRWGLLREGHFRGLEVTYSLFVATFTLVFGLSFFGVPNGNLRMSCCVR
jgi:hypothetical protein